MNKNKNRINDEIKEAEVRLTGSKYKGQVISFWEALNLAKTEGRDLIEINQKPNPVICIIEDYNKFVYNQKKREKEQVKINKQNKQNLKEVRFGPNTDDHDFEFKKKHIINFLQKGDKVKAFVFFKGREIMYKDKGEILLLKLLDELEDYGTAESMPKLEGKRYIVFINPKKKK
jgi:translation initiation factor IF-3